MECNSAVTPRQFVTPVAYCTKGNGVLSWQTRTGRFELSLAGINNYHNAFRDRLLRFARERCIAQQTV